MKRIEATSYPISIFIAHREGGLCMAGRICRDFCDRVGLCVTVTETSFIYTDGAEPGVIVGLINYPRFPKEPHEIFAIAEALAAELCDRLEQQSYTIQAPDKTVWISHRTPPHPSHRR